MNPRIIYVLTCLSIVSILCLSFVTNIYAVENFPTYNKVEITVSGIPGQTGKSVTDVNLTPSPCSAQNNATCTGFSNITIPGIGDGHLLVIFKNHKANPNQVPILTPVILIIISAGLLLLPTILGITGGTMFGDNIPLQATFQITIPPKIGQITVQLS